jgi:hypothetical protein
MNVCSNSRFRTFFKEDRSKRLTTLLFSLRIIENPKHNPSTKPIYTIAQKTTIEAIHPNTVYNHSI